MSYSIKEAFYSLQGEGIHSGRPAIFCRFTGCNLWSGREIDRAKAACNFCDTDFIGTDGQNGGRFATPEALAKHLLEFWPSSSVQPYLVLTGGEPLLQVDEPLISALRQAGFFLALETNGTLEVPEGIDWICVSPKGRNALQQQKGNELKLVYPQADVDPASFLEMDFDHFILQPLDGSAIHSEQMFTAQALEYCLNHPEWRLGLQVHKYLRID